MVNKVVRVIKYLVYVMNNGFCSYGVEGNDLWYCVMVI